MKRSSSVLLLLVASFLAATSFPCATASAEMILTSAGVTEGFSLSTFASGFASSPNGGLNEGPLGIAFANGRVLVTDFADNAVHILPSDADGQNAASAPFVSYGSAGTTALAQMGGTIYMGQYYGGSLVQINADGTFNQTIITGLLGPTGMVVNPGNGHLFVADYVAGRIFDVNPASKTSTVLIPTVPTPDGLSLSPDGHTLYVASQGHILGFDVSSHSQVFDSGFIGSVDGTIAGAGPLSGLIFANTNDGQFLQVDLATNTETILATGGTRGDFVTLDPSNGSLLLTQSDTILRLTPPQGGFAVPEPSSILLLGTGLLCCVACRRRSSHRWNVRRQRISTVVSSIGAFVLLIVASSARGDVVLVNVPGTADPWLAGMPDGSTASLGDTAPAQSPASVVGLNYEAGGNLSFSVSGSVNYGGGPPTDPPDGNVGYIIQHATGAENGLSNIYSPVDALLGVFLGPDQPNLSAAPGTLDFSTSSARDYTSLSPALQQVFFIGNGLTSADVTQQVVIPEGATRLFLGSMDGFGWWNNSGSFTVNVTGPGVPSVPEPSSVYAFVLGAAAFIARVRSRDRKARLGRA